MDHSTDDNDRALTIFLADLMTSLGRNMYCTNIVMETNTTDRVGLCCLCIANGIPKMSICAEVPCVKSSKTSRALWELELNHDILKTHMEDDLNIYTNNGIRSFGIFFAKALKSSVLVDCSYDDSRNYLPLKLSYYIGGRDYIGILKVPLVQDKLDRAVLDMMYSIEASRVVSSSITESVSTPTLSITGDSQPISQEDRKEETSQGGTGKAPPAKKRRVGGVSVNPSRRKR